MSHQLTLSDGSMEPRAGTSGTRFLFAVTYSDSGNCAPNDVRVRVAGIGTFAMSGSGTDYDGGVRFSRRLKITTPGTYSYVFLSTSGSGNGEKSVKLTDVRPRSFRVTAPAPNPTPTPRSTPKPTPKATPSPAGSTPAPAPTATPSPTAKARAASPSPKQTRKARKSRAASPSPTAAGAIGPGSTAKPGGFRLPAHPRRSTNGPFELFDIDVSPTVARLVQWGTITGGGLLLLLFLTAQRRQQEEPALAVASTTLPGSPPAPATPAAEAAAPRTPRRDEENMPRWLRPSVRAARQGRTLED